MQKSDPLLTWFERKIFLIIIELASVAYNGTALFYCLAVLVEANKIYILYMDGQWFLGLLINLF